MDHVEGFNFISDKNSTKLILGSAPSVKSLSFQEYYAHSQNSFWKIILNLSGRTYDTHPSYEDRIQIMLSLEIGLWDVMRACRRKGSLDSSIEFETAEMNDFSQIISASPRIEKVFFNGKSAHQLYLKSLRSSNNKVMSPLAELKYQVLPSTSPANAKLNFKQKLDIWRDEILRE